VLALQEENDKMRTEKEVAEEELKSLRVAVKERDKAIAKLSERPM
jgi:Centrosome localisation domain of PPC89